MSVYFAPCFRKGIFNAEKIGFKNSYSLETKRKKNPLERIQNLGLVVVCFGLGLFFCWVSFLLADAFEKYVFSGLR